MDKLSKEAGVLSLDVNFQKNRVWLVVGCWIVRIQPAAPDAFSCCFSWVLVILSFWAVSQLIILTVDGINKTKKQEEKLSKKTVCARIFRVLIRKKKLARGMCHKFYLLIWYMKKMRLSCDQILIWAYYLCVKKLRFECCIKKKQKVEKNYPTIVFRTQTQKSYNRKLCNLSADLTTLRPTFVKFKIQSYACQLCTRRPICCWLFIIKE
jgi:hypothetical protein